jgi:hypothetical protein
LDNLINRTTEKAKQKLWTQYLNEYGRHMCIIRTLQYVRLTRIGIPNALRGEQWEVSCGAMYKRFLNPEYYQQLHEKNRGKQTFAIEEIEKDLNR